MDQSITESTAPHTRCTASAMFRKSVEKFGDQVDARIKAAGPKG